LKEFSMIKKAMVAALCGLAALGARAEVVNIDSAELARLAARGVAVIDIRTAPEWQETGIIAGSRLMTFFDEKGRADPPAWLARVKSVARPDQPVILICRSGNRTRAAAQFLSQEAGYKTVYNVSGGMNAWGQEGRALVPPGSMVAGCAAGARC
jgi:rhodanese-related sulfurtransferase